MTDITHFVSHFLWLNGIRNCVSRNSLGEVAKGLWLATSLGTTNSWRFRVYTSPPNNKNPFLQKRSVDRAFDISFCWLYIYIYIMWKYPSTLHVYLISINDIQSVESYFIIFPGSKIKCFARCLNFCTDKHPPQTSVGVLLSGLSH